METSKTKKEPTPFYVLNEDINTHKFEAYDVMPYFVREYEDIKPKSKRPKTFGEFRQFVEGKSLYRYWARCEYEILLGSWPFGSHKMHTQIKEFLATNPDLDSIGGRIKFDNIIMRDMEKIDVHKQIMMNIDIVTKVLMDNVL